MKRQTTITVSEAARESDVLVNYLYALLASGRIRGERVDGRWVINRRDFESWRQQHRFYRKSRERQTAQHDSTARIAAESTSTHKQEARRAYY